MPVFQGEAGPGYVLGAPDAGTLTAFSFLSADAEEGSEYKLAVLHPTDASDTSWTLAHLSPAEKVISETGADGVNGPYPIDLPIAAGDRIGLLPIGVKANEHVPIEMGSAAYVVRAFTFPFSSEGATSSVEPVADGGDILPVQATLSYTPPSEPVQTPPSEIGQPTSPAASPPTLISPPTITGKPQAGQTLKCETGAWTNSPSFSVTWSQTTSRLVPGAQPPKVVSVTTEVASGPTYVVPDLPEGVSITCTVTASNAATVTGGGPKATSAAVGIETIAPALAPSFSFVYHTQRNTPTISEGVGLGGINICRPGLWQHYPTAFTYEWLENVYGTRVRHASSKVVHRGQKITIPIALERHEIFCRVTASNSAGSTIANSNTVIVPRLAPRALGPIRIEVVEPPPVAQNPITTRETPLYWKSATATRTAFALKCHAPKFNRQVSTAGSWEAQFYAVSQSGPGLPSSGPFDPEDTLGGSTLEITPTVAPAHVLSAGDEPLLNGQAPVFAGAFSSWNGELAVRCSINAHIYGTKLHTVITSSVLYLLANLSVSGEIGGVPVENQAG